METKWHIDYDVPGAIIGYRAILDENDDVVCFPSPMGDKNARLIAAAPCLLEIMRELLAIARKYENRDVMLDADEILDFILES